jgi:cytoskeletal protein RodZ
MDTAAEVLLIIVSSVLSIFLVVLIIAGVWFIKVLKQTRKLMEHAENVADSVEAAASAFERTATPLSVLKIISGIIGQASRQKKRKG